MVVVVGGWGLGAALKALKKPRSPPGQICEMRKWPRGHRVRRQITAEGTIVSRHRQPGGAPAHFHPAAAHPQVLLANEGFFFFYLIYF